ncbi:MULTISPECIES: trypsin-like peptidase domain-containing protein [Comamonadaceae]|jgi:serine protease DegQ|uniref:S1C family serine protease n=1 Tax=Comamonadaceae TaxID=80864 RepID=UPI000BDD38BB|nr:MULTISPECIES: trypsin-like peptidase domain-containing protein [Comamonadaceae]OZA58652.1 MAG: 2-alkenal reductase [Acidovorax sp. 17-64-282]HQT18651.1 trypsin-like peptidase domain-containing protein [Acidovorax defluvii]OYY26784.1 MAG: 2-alkenal reductase [Acidovorax sp. 35-64-16]OYY86542.1 MAG: 2-alkenal reductase [Acidovorax sp. 28-64-14]OYZ45000.1 MAG: 2-alkenal reductase [Acidovorax sp. 16-64-162]
MSDDLVRRPSALRRLWLLLAQAIAIGAGVIIAWRAFGPAPVPVTPDVVAVQEAPHAGATTGSAPATPSAITARLEAGFRAAAANASASVVNIYTRKTPPRRMQNWLRPDGGDEDAAQGASSLGSGVIVAAQGYILTNNHVVEGADEIAVMLPGEKVATARVVGIDPESDLAVLRVEATGLQPITFADPASVQVGDIVLAVGDPFGVGQTVTQGIVSATGRNRLGINTFENFIQTDAAINPGNSGGALVDGNGHLVGINTAIYSRSGGSQGIGFAIPVSLARQVMEQIIATGRVRRGWLGVSARDVIHEATGATGGAALVAVQRGGPADRAGLRPGDTVLAINGKEIPDTAGLIGETAAVAPGSNAQFKILRGRETVTVQVELGQRPAVRKP